MQKIAKAVYRRLLISLLTISAALAAAPSSSLAEQAKPFPSNGRGDYQLGGAYPPPEGVQVLVRDSKEKPLKGKFNVCYINGFQTQPGESWPSDLILKDSKGRPIVDPDWPDENILDISTDAKRKKILKKMEVTIANCAKAGFDAVEFDNLDSYTRSRGLLKLAATKEFARLLVAATHGKGLKGGQKNTPELTASDRKKIGFDFAVAEECQRYDECAQYTKYYGTRVMDIEYTDNLKGKPANVCADRSRPAITIIRDRELIPRGKKGYFYHAC